MIEFQLKKIDENLKELLKLKNELELKKENIRYFENFSKYEIPEIKFFSERSILLKKGEFKDESEINLELKKLKRSSEEDNDFKLEEWEKGNYFNYMGTFVITDEIKNSILESGEYLTYFFRGDYNFTEKHYITLKKYMNEKGYRAKGDIIELYHIEMHITENKEEYVTEIQIPLEKI